MKVYGADICIDYRNYKAIQKNRNLDIQFIDILENTANLRDFLKLRDSHPVFSACRENGGIGIPCFVNEKCVTLDIDEAFSWIRQPPVKPEEIVEHRE